MKIKTTQEKLLKILQTCSCFIATKFSSLPALRGVYIKGEEEKLHFFATNLNSYYHTSIAIMKTSLFELVIEPRKIIEFLSLLSPGEIELEIKEKAVHFYQKKIKGVFPVIESNDFPLPPETKGEKQRIKTNFFTTNLPLVLFSVSPDESRPVLTAVNFLSQEGAMTMVSTDGFRLSLLKTKKEIDIPSLLISSDFLEKVIKEARGEESLVFGYLVEDKMVYVQIGEAELYSRLIDGEFPPFGKVIPQEAKTTIIFDREEFLRNVKLVSVFARDYSNVVVCTVRKEGVHLRPKTDRETENDAFQEVEFSGEEQSLAFNYKFLIDFLNTIDSKKIIMQVLRPDAPVVFKSEEYPDFLHIIMPVRIQE